MQPPRWAFDESRWLHRPRVEISEDMLIHRAAMDNLQSRCSNIWIGSG